MNKIEMKTRWRYVYVLIWNQVNENGWKRWDNWEDQL